MVYSPVSPPFEEETKPELLEKWEVGPWQFTLWRDFDGDKPEEWYRFGRVQQRVTFHDDRYKSLGEAMLVAVAEQYEAASEATWTAFMCARLIGMHQFDGDEWVHQDPPIPYRYA